MRKTTDDLSKVLKKTRPQNIDEFLSCHADEMITDDRPFASFMRQIIKESGMNQQEVFIGADIPERYGYKIISEEKHTKQRDVIIRLCLGAHLHLDEMQHALMLYQMSPLYSRLTRDALIAVCVDSGHYDIPFINNFLIEHGEAPLSGNYIETK